MLRYAGLLALTLWVGGLVVLAGIAAPSIFDVVEGQAAGSGRLLAGAIFGEVLRRFHLLSYVCGVVLVSTLLARRVLGPRPVRFAVRLGIACLMCAAMLSSGMIVSVRIAQAQSSIGAAPSSLPPNDPRRVAFGRLHALSTGLLAVPVFGGLVLLFRELKD